MAYQPIQMPQPEGFGDGLAEMIMAARRQSQQENAQRAEMELQRQRLGIDQERLSMDRTTHQQQGMAARIAATQQITAALDAGRPDLARQIAQAAGLGEIVENKKDPRDALMKPSFETEAPKPQPPPTMDIEKSNDPAAVQANEKAIGDYQTQLAGYKPGETQYEFGGMRPVREPTYKVAGQEYDPLQSRMAAEARRGRDTEQVRGAFAPLGYGDEAAALAAANTQDRPIDISKLIATRMERDNAREAAKTEKETNREFIRGENEKYRSEPLTVQDRKDIAGIGAGGRVEAAGASAGPRQDQFDLQARKYVDETVGRYEKESGIPKLLTTMDQFRIASAELKRPSGASQVGARMVVEKALRGGPPTQYMDEQEQKHLSGLWGRIQGMAETLQTGQFGPEQLQAIQHEIDAAAGEFEGAVDRRYQGLAARLSGDEAFGNLQGSVNRRVAQTFAPFGRKVPDIFPGGKDRIGAIGSRSVAGSTSVAPKPETVGLTDDPNDDRPLPEDPNADELPAPTRAAPRAPVNREAAAHAASRDKNAARANAEKRGATASEAQIRDRAIKLHRDPDADVARAKRLGILQ